MYVTRNPDYFLAIAREGNISRAAQRLYISQSSLSQHLSRLENELGVQLFDRSQFPMRLTPAGQVYKEYLESHQTLYQKMLADINSNHIRKISVGVGTWRGAILLPQVLPEFLRRHPEAEIHLDELPTVNELVPALEQGWIDFAVRNTGPEGLPQSIISENILNEQIRLVMRKDHPLTQTFLEQSSRDEGIDLHLLESERYICREPSIPLGRHIDNFLSRKRLNFPKRLVTLNNNTALRLTAAGVGFCFMLETGLLAELSDELISFDLASPDLALPLTLLYKSGNYLSPLTQELMEQIRAYYRKFREADAMQPS